MDADRFPNVFETINSKRQKVKYVYNMLLALEDNHAITVCYSKIARYINITMEEYRQAFINLCNITEIVKYCDFPYQVLCNVIFTNNRLFYWKKVPSKQCEYCDCTNPHVFAIGMLIYKQNMATATCISNKMYIDTR